MLAKACFVVAAALAVLAGWAVISFTNEYGYHQGGWPTTFVGLVLVAVPFAIGIWALRRSRSKP